MPRNRQRMGRIMPGTFASVIRAYMNSRKWGALAPSTRRNYNLVLKIAEMEGGLGGCSVQVIRPALIQGFLDGLADTPGRQSIAKTALKAVEKFAVVRDLVPTPFMTGTTVLGSETGFEPWSLEQVALAERHARPDLARAVTLAVNTGQRGSDTVRMCPNDIEEMIDPLTNARVRGINVRQQKTDVRLWVPFLPEFDAIIASWGRNPGPFLRRPRGKPYTRQQLSEAWNYELRTNKELKPLADAGLVLHGLRATAVVYRRKRGLNPLQISSMIGMSLQMVERYCRLADKTDLALAAVHFLRTGEEQRPSIVRSIEN
jgi:integrase